MIDKVCESTQPALHGVRDGATVMIGGFGGAGHPNEPIDALVAQGARDLTVVNNNAGNGETGQSKIVSACTCPLTGIGCVSRIYTDLAVIDVTPAGLKVVDIFNGLSLAELQGVTGVRDASMAGLPPRVPPDVGAATAQPPFATETP
jgi:acyl CoA:acetate/3-ketoacid CoA transferase beta subunit